MNALIDFRRATPELIAEAQPLVERDKATILRASDMILRDNKVIGYLSIASVPSVHLWFDSQKALPRDYLTAVSYFEGVLSRGGAQEYWLPCESTSPLLKFIPRLGHIKTNFDNMFIKQLITK